MQEKVYTLFISLNNSENTNLNCENIKKELIKNEYQACWFYIVEENQNNKHFHVLLGVKCLLEYNENFKINILNNIKNNLSLDIVLTKAVTFEIIKQKFVYILKDSFIENNNNLNTHFFIYDDYIKSKNELFVNYIEVFIKTDTIKNFSINNTVIGSSYNKKATENTKESTLNLIKFYFIKYDIKYKNGFLFKKIKKSDNSYYQYNTITWIKENLFIIYTDLLLDYKLNLEGTNFDDFLIKNKVSEEDLHLTLKNLPHNSNLSVRFDIIEFQNGYYLFNYNKFIYKKTILEYKLVFNEKIIIVKYYEKIYNRRLIPNNWKNVIMSALNFDQKKFEIICAYLANTIIKNKDVFEKKKVLYVWGNSSTGKTTIIAKPLWKYFGEDNIGIISGSKNFAFEKLVNKEIAILDEYKFNKKRRETDLKLFEGQTIIEDSKYKEQQKIKELNLIVLSNFSVDPEDYQTENEKKNTDTALANRVKLVKFLSSSEIKNPVNLTTDTIKKIDEEDPYILIYCNKIYNKLFIKNKGKTKNKNILQKITNKSILQKKNDKQIE